MTTPPTRPPQPSSALRVWIVTLLLALFGFVIAFQFVGPAPPDRVVIAAGPEDGIYARFATRYQTFLEQHGITLEIRFTSGSIENLEQLDRDNDVQIGLVQSGCGDRANSPYLRGLASLAIEPVWLFHRQDLPLADLRDLRGRRLGTGLEGSGSRIVAMEVLRKNGLDASSVTVSPLANDQSAAALEAGTLDAACFVVGSESPLVKQLLASSKITLFEFERADAYAQIFRHFSRVVLPRGVVDLELDLPPQDVELIGTLATLVAHQDLHPAVIDLLLQAADEVHRSGSLLEAPGEFPSAHRVDFPLSKEARRYFKHGPPFLQRYLPFWAATFLDRMKVMLLPLLTLMIPLIKTVPPLYRWRMRNRIFRWYRDLIEVDLALKPGISDEQAAAQVTALDRIEADVEQVTVPLSLADELYELRVHIELVRSKVRSCSGSEGKPSSGNGNG